MQPLANPSCIASRKWLNVRSNKKGRCFRRATAQTSYFSVQKECYPKTRPTTPSSLQSDLLSTLTKYKRTIRIWMTISRPQEWCYDSYPLSFILEPDTHVGFSVKGILVIRCSYKIMHSSFPSKTYWKLMRLQCNLIHVTKTYNLRTQQHLHLRSPTFGGSCVEHEKICADVDQPTLLETFQGDRI